jgi:uncharacterized protein involved in exopolysaccharide biosynthesis
MGKDKQEVSQADRVEEEDTINLLDLLLVFARHKKKILIIPLLIGCAVAVYSLQAPVVYTASTTFVPSPTGVPGEILLSFLKSRSMQDQVLSKHKLQTASAVNFSIGRKDGIINVTVHDGDPEKAAQMANAYVNELREFSSKTHPAQKEGSALSWEDQLEKATNTLSVAEAKLSKFMNKNGLIAIAEQGESIVKVAGRLRDQITRKQHALAVAINKGADKNPEMQELASEISKLRDQLAKIESVQPLEFARLIRDRDEASSNSTKARKKYESAKLKVESAEGLFQVLDVAVPPGRRSNSINTTRTLKAVVASGFLVCLLAFILEAKRQAEQDPEQAEKMAELKNLRKL